MKVAVRDYGLCFQEEPCWNRRFCICLENIDALEKEHKSIDGEIFSTWKAWKPDWLTKLRRKARKRWPTRAFKLELVDAYRIEPS